MDVAIKQECISDDEDDSEDTEDVSDNFVHVVLKQECDDEEEDAADDAENEEVAGPSNAPSTQVKSKYLSHNEGVEI